MKPSKNWWLVLVIVAIVGAYVAGLARGQQPDTLDPVLDVAKSGELVASITCPTRVQAGNALVLDVSGTSEGQTVLRFDPPLPPGAVHQR